MLLPFFQTHPFLSALIINPNVNLDTSSTSWNFLLGQMTETTGAFRTWTLRKPPTRSQLWPQWFWWTGTFPNNSQVIWLRRKFICCTKSSSPHWGQTPGPSRTWVSKGKTITENILCCHQDLLERLWEAILQIDPAESSQLSFSFIWKFFTSVENWKPNREKAVTQGNLAKQEL